jgi:hypothetical protein
MTKRCRLLVVPHQQQVKFHPYRSLSLFPSLPSSPYPRVGGGQLFWCRRRWWGEAIQGLSHHRILLLSVEGEASRYLLKLFVSDLSCWLLPDWWTDVRWWGRRGP